jgi:hypothetical protein
MCSKPNPADAEVCKYCQARLKPVVASSQPAKPPENSKQPPASPSDGSDWLGNLRSDDSSGFDAESDTSFDAGGGDWFSRLGQDEEPAAKKPDWLSTPMEKGDPNVPDWMEELGVSGADNKAASDDWSQRLSSEETPASSSDQDDLKSWLAGLADTEDIKPQKDSTPDWMSAFGKDAGQAEPAATAEDNLPDWLASLSGEESAEFTFGDTQLETPASPASPAMPDWASASADVPETPVDKEPPAESSAGVPDWLADMQAADLNTPTSQEPAPSGDDTLPAWLSDAADSSDTSFESPLSSNREPPTQPITDWLSQFEQVASGGDELPDQMLTTSKLDEEVPPKAAQEPEKTLKPFPTGSLGTGDLSSFGTTPDWLSDLGDLSLGDEDLSSQSPAEQPATTDWLSGLGDLTDEEPATPVTKPPDAKSPATPGVSAFVMDQDAWGNEAGEETFEMPDLDATPDWLSGVTAQDSAAADEPAPESGSDDSMAPAELPTWLEAMRPLESAAPASAFRDESDARVESAGPLSGLRGVLRAEPEIANFRKPPTYINKVQVTEAHQAHIALLEELVAAEGRPKPVQPFVRVKSQLVLRLVIAFGLIAAILLGFVGRGTQQVPLPGEELLPQEIRNMRGSIEALAPNAPVLVAMDYEAGATAEMGYPAQAVLQNLEQKNAYIAFVSTNINGPMMSELLIGELNVSSSFTYTNYTILGYLPGGASGLLSFARAPRPTLSHTMYSSSKQDGWSNTPLASVNLMSDFALVIVMTDNADTARLWLEQAYPYLDANTPMLMVLSAQAEPLVRPYFQQSLDPDLAHLTGPLAGYVAGMAGWAAYQHKVTPTAVLKEWDALGLASVAACVIIALGGIINLGLAISNRPKGKK